MGAYQGLKGIMSQRLIETTVSYIFENVTPNAMSYEYDRTALRLQKNQYITLDKCQTCSRPYLAVQMPDAQPGFQHG